MERPPHFYLYQYLVPLNQAQRLLSNAILQHMFELSNHLRFATLIAEIKLSTSLVLSIKHMEEKTTAVDKLRWNYSLSIYLNGKYVLLLMQRCTSM
jgi:hypothetical protein